MKLSARNRLPRWCPLCGSTSLSACYLSGNTKFPVRNVFRRLLRKL